MSSTHAIARLPARAQLGLQPGSCEGAIRGTGEAGPIHLMCASEEGYHVSLTTRLRTIRQLLLALLESSPWQDMLLSTHGSTFTPGAAAEPDPALTLIPPAVVVFDGCTHRLLAVRSVYRRCIHMSATTALLFTFRTRTTCN